MIARIVILLMPFPLGDHHPANFVSLLLFAIIDFVLVLALLLFRLPSSSLELLLYLSFLPLILSLGLSDISLLVLATLFVERFFQLCKFAIKLPLVFTS